MSGVAGTGRDRGWQGLAGAGKAGRADRGWQGLIGAGRGWQRLARAGRTRLGRG